MSTVLITGVGRGIGKALAEAFISRGHRVIGTALSSMPTAGDPSAFPLFSLDLADTASIASCAKSISAELAKTGGKIDILINNAGVLLDDEETKLFADKLRKTLEVNVVGTADFTEQIAPLMSPNGHIVFISSEAGSLADMDHIERSHFPYHYPAYKISKCALNMYMRTLAARLHHEGDGIAVSSVHPGWVKTDMGGSNAPVSPEEAASHIYDLAVSHPETGQFWFNGKKYLW